MGHAGSKVLHSRQYGVDELPSVAKPDEGASDEVPIDVDALVHAIKQIA